MLEQIPVINFYSSLLSQLVLNLYQKSDYTNIYQIKIQASSLYLLNKICLNVHSSQNKIEIFQAIQQLNVTKLLYQLLTTNQFYLNKANNTYFQNNKFNKFESLVEQQVKVLQIEQLIFVTLVAVCTMNIKYERSDIETLQLIRKQLSNIKYKNEVYTQRYLQWLNETITNFNERSEFLEKQPNKLQQQLQYEIVDVFKQNQLLNFVNHVNYGSTDVNSCIKAYYEQQMQQIDVKYLKFNEDIDQGLPYCICGKEAKYRCMQCKMQWYCSKECQRQDWKRHKQQCKQNEQCKQNTAQNAVQSNNKLQDIINQAENAAKQSKW